MSALKTLHKVHTDDDLSIGHSRHPAQWVGTVLCIVVAAGLVYTLSTNPNYRWSVVWKYLFAPVILQGVLTTVLLTLGALIIGTALATGLAIARLSSNWLLRGCSGAYLWFFRGTPVLVQVIFWFNVAALYPVLTLPAGETLSMNDFITPITAALLALGLNEAAYMTEIIRAGILSVDPGQREAAQSIGMSRAAVTWKVVLPQAMRIIIPPYGSEVIQLSKATALVSVIGTAELLYTAQIIYTRTYETIPLLIVVSIWYLAFTTVLTFAQSRLESRFGRGHQPRKRGRSTVALATGRSMSLNPEGSTSPTQESPDARVR